MAEFEIDMNMLVMAFEDESPDNSYYLDRDTGNVILIQKELLDIRELTDEVEYHNERYLYIPRTKHKQIRQDLEDFIETVQDAELSRLLVVALESPNPIPAINCLLLRSKIEQLRFQEFRLARMHIRIRQWLAANFLGE